MKNAGMCLHIYLRLFIFLENATRADHLWWAANPSLYFFECIASTTTNFAGKFFKIFVDVDKKI